MNKFSANQFETTVRVMNKENQFKSELKAPKPTKMIITKNKIIFKGNPKNQDNSFLREKSRYEINKSSIIEVKFNRFFNSAIKISFNKNGEKIAYIQFLSNNRLAPYSAYATNVIYTNLNKFLTGKRIKNKGIPGWLHFSALVIFIVGIILGRVLGEIIGAVMGGVTAIVINILLYKFFMKIEERK